MASRTRRVLVGALVPVLVAGGLAVANQDQGGKNQAQDGNGRKVIRAFRGHPGPPPFRRNLTYGELHIQRDGKAVVVRIDTGKVKSVDSNSVTVTENDGSDVTIPVNGDTKVLAGPFRKATISDVKEGRRVLVNRDQGQPARAIVLLPKPGERPPFGPRGARGLRHEMPLPPPDDGQQGEVVPVP
jgi:hypothetical protein